MLLNNFASSTVRVYYWVVFHAEYINALQMTSSCGLRFTVHYSSTVLGSEYPIIQLGASVHNECTLCVNWKVTCRPLVTTRYSQECTFTQCRTLQINWYLLSMSFQFGSLCVTDMCSAAYQVNQKG